MVPISFKIQHDSESKSVIQITNTVDKIYLFGPGIFKSFNSDQYSMAKTLNQQMFLFPVPSALETKIYKNSIAWKTGPKTNANMFSNVSYIYLVLPFFQAVII